MVSGGSGLRHPTQRQASCPPVVVLASGTGTLLGALIGAARDGSLGGTVSGVISDRPEANALRVAQSAGIATAVVNPREFDDQASWDLALTAATAAFAPRLVVSAGFMRLLGSGFLAQFGGRTINSHPALLPSFPGAHAVAEALAVGVPTTGCTVHYVDAGMDTGPVIAQTEVEIESGDTVGSLHERIKTVEQPLLVNVVRKLVSDPTTDEEY